MFCYKVRRNGGGKNDSAQMINISSVGHSVGEDTGGGYDGYDGGGRNIGCGGNLEEKNRKNCSKYGYKNVPPGYITRHA